jgi:hypothetical protein
MTFVSYSGRSLARNVIPVAPCRRGNQQIREVIR